MPHLRLGELPSCSVVKYHILSFSNGRLLLLLLLLLPLLVLPLPPADDDCPVELDEVDAGTRGAPLAALAGTPAGVAKRPLISHTDAYTQTHSG